MRDKDKQIPKRIIKIAVKATDGKRVEGNVNLQKYDRLSDLLAGEKSIFITMFNCTSDGPKVRIVNKFQIVWVEPIDETIQGDI